MTATAQPNAVSYYETAMDVLEKLNIASTIAWHALPGGRCVTRHAVLLQPGYHMNSHMKSDTPCIMQ